MNQATTPILDMLKKHKEGKPLSLHVPGHKYGTIFLEQAKDIFGPILEIDATELAGLDDLHAPEEGIRQAEELLADLYQVKKSFLLVNGSTVGNLAMILAAVKEGDEILVQRNCHKSILNGIHLSKADPVFLSPDFDDDWGVAGGVTYETVEQAIKLYPNSKALILTYPNYYGMVYDLESIIKLAHAHSIPVLIDEAHGAHFKGGHVFPKTAVELGADIVVQSAHKSLPAMTMSSFLHFNSELLPLAEISKYLRMLQSSSPSYPLMASLDVARSYLGTYTREDAEYLAETITDFKVQLGSIKGIKVLPYSNGSGDLLKITLQSQTDLNGYELQTLLEQQGIYTELADPDNILLMLPLLKKGKDYPFNEIIKGITNGLDGRQEKLTRREKIAYVKPKISKLVKLETGSLKEESMELESSVDMICAESIIPYPPGIPILMPGEVITKGDIEGLKMLIESGARFQGGDLLKEGKITVYK